MALLKDNYIPMKKLLYISVITALALAGTAEAKVLSGSVEQVGDVEISVPAVVVGDVDTDISVEVETENVGSPDEVSDDDDSLMRIAAESEEIDAESSNEISIRAVEVRGWNSEKKAEILGAALTRTEVQTDEDLSNFAATMVINDENIDSVEVDDEEIEVVYKFPAKFLGIFKTNVRAHVIAQSPLKLQGGESNAVVKFSWFSFLYTMEESLNIQNLKGALDIQLSEVGREIAGSNIATSATLQAHMLDVVGAVLRVRHDTVKNSIGNIR